jgi:hydroxymethylpyrimidine/phosphomethylpyrimidine kinase
MVQPPNILTIAGSDSGGGAGIQADLKTMTAMGAFGMSVITALTAQNPLGVRNIQPASLAVLRDQISAIAEAFSVKALKTGMLVDAEHIRVVAETLPLFQGLPLIVDPVMVSTSGKALLAEDAVEVLTTVLLPHAALVTPNLPESNALLGRPIDAPIADLAAHARALFDHLQVPILLKGGHHATSTATDCFIDAEGHGYEICSPIVAAPLTTHGTGCSLSAAITANLARGETLLEAICRAKAWLYTLLKAGVSAGEVAVYGVEATPLPREGIQVRPLTH